MKRAFQKALAWTYATNTTRTTRLQRQACGNTARLLIAVCCGVRGRVLAWHIVGSIPAAETVFCYLLQINYKLRSIYKSWKAQWFGIHFNLVGPSKSVLVYAFYSLEYVLGLTRCSGVCAKIILLYKKSLAVFPQACLCKRVVLVVFVASVHARAFWKALFTR